MASFATPIGENLMAIATMSLYNYGFRLPYCRTFDVEACFKNSKGLPEAAEFVRSIHAARGNMCRVFSTACETHERLRAIEDYLPLVKKLLDITVEQQVRLDQPLLFDWKGCLTTTEQPVRMHDVLYDLVMSLHAKAIMSYSVGIQLTKNTATLANAAQNFIAAANCMEYILKLLPKWLQHPGMLRPPEASEATCRMLLHFFKASAQQVAFAKAILKEGGSSSTVLAKLAVGCYDELKLSMQAIKTSQDINRIEPDFFIFLSLIREVFHIIAYLYHGKTFFDKNEPGTAIACFRKAKLYAVTQNGKQYDSSQIGVPKFTGRFENATAPFRGLLDAITLNEQAAQKENNMIYFQGIPKDDEVPELPIGALLAKTTPFEIPPPMLSSGGNNIVFVYDVPKQKSIIGSVFDSLSAMNITGKKSDSNNNTANSAIATATATQPTTTQPATTNRQRSDSDLARELQQRLNNGENL